MQKYFGIWNVQQVYNQSIGNLGATIEFRGTESIFGFSSCNTYSGSYSLNQQALTLKFGPIMATKKACAENIMKAESDLYRALNNTVYYKPTPQGIYFQNLKHENLAFITKQ